ncbi:HXXEE domain-containing protein [Cryptosporangium sp. NPDC051539]|uniref:HXXEE domain-containing protein n=1 Tax=Cryptosporangium sp. NPDC051539 TaxID=3363962 RepID=UPI00379B9CD2
MTSSAADPPRAVLTRSARWWIWGLLAAFVAHDGEEAIAIVRQHGLFMGDDRILTVTQGLAAILFEFGLYWAAVVAAVWTARPGWAVRLFGLLLAGWTLHGVGHLGSAIAQGGGYGFGSLTAFPCCVVYGILAFWRLRADGLLSRRELLAVVVLGLPASAPLLLGAHGFAHLIA